MNCKNKSFVTKRKAFTLIELLIVIAIIGILFIVLISKVDFATDKAKATGVQTDFRSFQLAFDAVAKENAGFNTFGWDTGDANQDGIRNSYDEGDNGAGGGTAKNGIQDGDEVFTGHKVYDETFTKVFSLKKNGTGNYDRDALNRLETAINANLDPKLHITIADDGTITMANGAQDPWNKEYHGNYITNAEVDGKDRGAIVMYSDGANNEFGSEHKIANGVVSISIPGNNKYGKDDYAIISVYTYINGYGEVKNITTGFSNNQNMNVGNNDYTSNIQPENPDINGGTESGGNEPEEDDIPEVPELIIAPGLYASGQNYAPEALITPWNELVENGVVKVENGALSCLNEYYLRNGDLMVPNDGSVTAIADKGFHYVAYMTGIALPESLTTIGNSAFSYCKSFTTITIPNSVTSIGDYAFSSCEKLESIIICNNVTSIGDGAFLSDSCLTNVDFGNDSQLTSIGDKAFMFCRALTHITIPSGVTYIGFDSFNSCSNLQNIEIPDNVTSIGYNAFASCKNLESVTFTKNSKLENMGSGIFTFCDSMINMTIPFLGSSKDNVENSNLAYLFGGTAYSVENRVSTSLKTVVVTGGTIIGDNAFYECPQLISVVFPDSISSIGKRAFYGCTGLTSIELPDSLTSIGEHAFGGCTGLTSVTVPVGVTSIGWNAFGQCNITSITIPFVGEKKDGTGKTHFGYIFGASQYYESSNKVPTSLKTVIITEGTSIGNFAFHGCKSITNIVFPDGVTSIGQKAFSSCLGLTSITIPDGITSIGDSAFEGCYNLNSITIPNSVTSIGNNAFTSCFTLVEVINHSSLNITVGSQTYGRIAYYALEVHNDSTKLVNNDGYLFYTYNGVSYLLGYCGEETNLIFPQNTNKNYSIYKYAFYNNDNITNVLMPDGVITICDNAFWACSYLTSVNIPNSVTTIGEHAFLSCESLESITIPNSVTSIGKEAFIDCKNLTSVSIQDGVQVISEYMFSDCSSLTNVTIPESITSIGKGAFHGCDSLKSITIPFIGEKKDGTGKTHFGHIFGASSYSSNSDTPESLQTVIITGGTSIGNNAFRNCYYITNIVMPDGITTIGNYAFEYCESLTSIVISNSVKNIGSYAFGDCYGLTSITIPDSVTSIGSYAFEYCENLSIIEFEGTKEQWNAMTLKSGWNDYIPATNIQCSDGSLKIK